MAKHHTKDCPVAAVLNLFGDHWSWLIIREGFYGSTRFSEFQRRTGIAKNLLSDRLAMLVEAGLFEKENVAHTGTRFAYHLTEKGRSLQPVLFAMYQWGNAHLYEDGKQSVQIIDQTTREPVTELQAFSASGTPVDFNNIITIPGPGASEGVLKRFARNLTNDPVNS